MGKLMIVGLILLISFLAYGQGPQIVSVPIEQSYIPLGFDDNDRVQVMIEGTFRNSCYKVASYKVTAGDSGEVIIQQFAYKYPGICLEVLVPYTQTVDLGLMKSGTYTLRDGDSKNVIGHLIGIDHELRFDVHAGVIYDSLLSKSRDKILESRHFCYCCDDKNYGCCRKN